MLVWLWPFTLGLAGFTTLSLWAAVVGGVFFDTHATTPFGLTAMVGVVLAFGASRLGKEGVGDLDSAAWWVTPILAAAAGLAAPAIYTVGGVGVLNFSLWHGSLVNSMVVERESPSSSWPVRSRASRDASALSACGPIDEGLVARPTLGLSVLTAVATLESLHPFRGKGRSINEPKPVGIRDLVAQPGEVKLRPERRWYVIGGFFFLLFLLLVGRLYVLTGEGLQAVGRARWPSNAIRKASIPASRGTHPRPQRSAAGQQRDDRRDPTVARRGDAEPVDRGHAGVADRSQGRPDRQDLANQAYNPYQPAPILANAPANVVQFIKLHPASSRASRCSTSRSARTRSVAASDPRSSATSVPSPKNEIKAHPGAGYQTDSTIGKTGIEAFYEQYLRGHDGTSRSKSTPVAT